MGIETSLAVAIGIPLVEAALVGVATQKQIDTWYKNLKKPWWTPPNWLLGLGGLAMQACMGTASWMIWKKGGFEAQMVPLTLYAIQMVFKWFYEPLFFHFHAMGTALADLTLMDLFLTAAAVMFYKEDQTAGYLMIPYVAYSYFCTAFTAKIRALNKEKTEKGAKKST